MYDGQSVSDLSHESGSVLPVLSSNEGGGEVSLLLLLATCLLSLDFFVVCCSVDKCRRWSDSVCCQL